MACVCYSPLSVAVLRGRYTTLAQARSVELGVRPGVVGGAGDATDAKPNLPKMTCTYAVVGASRGIGLEFVRQLAARGDTRVFAVVRDKQKSVHLSAAIQGLGNVHVVEADVTDHKAMERAAGEVAAVTSGTLDCLIHNAALMDPAVVYRRYEDFKDLDELDTDFITAVRPPLALSLARQHHSRNHFSLSFSPSPQYKVNTLGLIHALAAFLPLLRASPAPTKKIVVVSTTGADPRAVLAARATHMAAYAASKAAALMVATQWAVKLGANTEENENGAGRFVVASVCPGVVDTSGTMGPAGDPAAHEMVVRGVEEMNRKGFPVRLETPAESVRAQLQIIDALTPADNGVFLSHHGQRYFG
ncbi:hypothetical protein ACG7TL_008060 [Trametes sanguinea]